MRRMKVEKVSPLGGIDISAQAIASVAGSAAIECYGVVGLGSKNTLTDKVDELLGNKNFSDGIYCEKNKKGEYLINIYIVASSSTKLTEVITEVQKKVKYVLEQTFSIVFNKVNVYIQGVKEIQ